MYNTEAKPKLISLLGHEFYSIILISLFWSEQKIYVLTENAWIYVACFQVVNCITSSKFPTETPYIKAVFWENLEKMWRI